MVNYLKSHCLDRGLNHLYYIYHTMVLFGKYYPEIQAGLNPDVRLPDLTGPHCLLIDNQDGIQPFLCAFLQNDGIEIAFPGFQYNAFGLTNIISLGVESGSYYSLHSFVARNLSRFHQDLHLYMRAACMENPALTKLRFAGHSYGASMSQVVGLIYAHIIAFHKKNYQSKENDTSLITTLVTGLYKTYLSGPTVQLIRSNLQDVDQFTKMVRSDLISRGLDDPTNDQIAESVMNVDRQIFGRLSVEEIYTFAGATTFTSDVHAIYDSFVEDCDVGSELTLYDRSYMFGLSNDPVFDLLSAGTLLGQLATIFAKGLKRYIVGQVVYLKTDEWMPAHLPEAYINYLLNTKLSGERIVIYDGFTVPRYYFPVTRAILMVPMIYKIFGTIYATLFAIGYIIMVLAVYVPLFYIGKFLCKKIFNC